MRKQPLKLTRDETTLIRRLRRNPVWLRAMLAGRAGDLVYLPNPPRRRVAGRVLVVDGVMAYVPECPRRGTK